MKIVVELVRVRQEWNPDTNKHTNSVIFSFGGVKVEVPATESQVKQIIIDSQAQQSAKKDDRPVTIGEVPDLSNEEVEAAGGTELDAALDEELETGDDNGDHIFGGDADEDVPVDPPSLFEPTNPQEASQDVESEAPPAPPATPTAQRLARVAQNRAVDPAAQRKATKDKMRERAASVPQRKVTQDDMGNPVVYQDRGAQIAGPVGRPAVRRQAVGTTIPGDDDGIEQG